MGEAHDEAVTEAPSGPQAVMDVRDIEAIRVMADERRLAILRQLREPSTVKDLAEVLGMPATKLYYHVHLLEQHGLVRVTHSRVVKGIVEKQYQASARHFRMRNPMLAGDALSGDQTAVLFADLMDRTRGELVAALRAEAAREQEGRQVPPRHPFVTRKHVNLSQAQLEALHARLERLVRDMDALSAENEGLSPQDREGLRPFALTLALHLRPEGDRG